MKLSIFQSIKDQLLRHKSIIIIMSIYLSFLVGSVIYFFIISRFRDVLMAAFFMLFIPLIFIIQYFLKIEFGPLFILIVLFIASGAILGACYDFYHLIPFFDDILHSVSGFIFSCLGYALVKVFFGEDDSQKKFFGSIVFGAIFSLMISLVWEVFEFTINELFGFDMLADTMIEGFNSYLLSGTHSEYISVQGITQTIIYYGDNQVLILNGYLDIGLFDSLYDMIVCLLGALLFILTTSFGHFKFKRFNEIVLPKLKKY